MADRQSSAALSAPPRTMHTVPDDAPRRGVLHVRHRHTGRFTVVGNHLAQHPSLSATAIGLAVHIQSLPDGASVTAKALTLRFHEGETTLRRALNELEAAGYLQRRRMPLGGGRFATRTVCYDKPGCTAPAPERRPVSARVATRTAPAPTQTPPAPAPAPPQAPTPRTVTPMPQPAAPPPPPPRVPSGPGPDLLARLRLADTRLLLSAQDIERLAPSVATWLSRSATPEQITRTLTTKLPPEPVPIHHPARFLEHRLTTHLPPPLPAAEPRPSSSRPRPVPLVSCHRCERAVRSHVPEGKALCADCQEEPNGPSE
ncbi:hypothetical protein N566_25955 [Streptomycetaceae bacterium MP113-05]|nr:hypothetical protein N566_25955 [Streptomycetaceae bacterium MP113-05]